LLRPASPSSVRPVLAVIRPLLDSVPADEVSQAVPPWAMIEPVSVLLSPASPSSVRLALAEIRPLLDSGPADAVSHACRPGRSSNRCRYW